MSEMNISPFSEGGTTQLAELIRHELRRNINDSAGTIGFKPIYLTVYINGNS